MDVILIPGFWLDASSWQAVLPPLHEAGHTTHPLTLPGLEGRDADRAGITLQDHVDAVVAEIDRIDGPVALVGHSGGGPIAYAAADARPERVHRIVYVDAGPLSPGSPINDELPVEGDGIPLPDWGAFDEAELVGLDEAAREAFRERSVPQPVRVATDGQALHDERRHAIPSTIIATAMPGETLQQLVEQGHPYVAEFARLTDVEVVDLPTGHWPQFSRPEELGAEIVRALDSAATSG